MEPERTEENEKKVGNNRNTTYATNDLPTWCFECRKPTEMVSTDEAATVANVMPLTIVHLAEQKALHHQVTTNGNLYICLNSLMHVVTGNQIEAEMLSKKL